MKVNFSRLNNELEINKKQIQASIAPKTRKEDKDYKYNLYPLVSVSIAQNLILQNNKLDKSISMMKMKLIKALLIFGKITLMNYTNKFKNFIHMDLERLK